MHSSYALGKSQTGMGIQCKMSELDLVIRNGTVVTGSDTSICDVGVSGGQIVEICRNAPAGTTEIDATGKLVLPGGVDAHVHLDEPPFFGVRLADDYKSGTESAACGGTTTILPFVQQEGNQTLREAVQVTHEKAKGKAVIDYALHIMLTNIDEQIVGQDLPALIQDGYTSYKVYMCYDGMVLDDGAILQVLEAAREHGATVLVHAESHHCIHHLANKLEQKGLTDIENFHAMSPMPVEREATHRAITLRELTDSPITIVHVSAREAMDQIRWGQDRGLKIYGETCPHFLEFTEDDVRRPGWEGAKYLCTPPLREGGNREFLWRGIANGVFQIVSSDHAPFIFDSDKGKKRGGGKPHFKHVPPGMPGVELRLPYLFSEGVQKKRISLNKFVEVTATNPAKIYGLYPRKGTIAVGSDADVAIWNPEREVTVTQDMLHDQMDYTPYEGMTLTGWPETVISRGEVIVDDGELTGKPGRGTHLGRDPQDVNPAGGRIA
jgi:dihydropyrimidinase